MLSKPTYVTGKHIYMFLISFHFHKPLKCLQEQNMSHGIFFFLKDNLASNLYRTSVVLGTCTYLFLGYPLFKSKTEQREPKDRMFSVALLLL